MAIDLTEQQQREIEQHAEKRGYADTARYLLDLVEKDNVQPPTPGDPVGQPEEDWAWLAIEQVAGSATGGLSTEEIMRTSRSEV